MSQLLLADRPRPLLLQYRRTFADTVRDLTRQRPDLMATDLGVVSDSTFAVSFSGSVEVSVDSDQSASPRRMFIIDSMATLETAITDIDEKMRQELDRQLHETQDEMVARSRAADAVGLTEFSYQSMWRTPRGVRSGRFSAPNGEMYGCGCAACQSLREYLGATGVKPGRLARDASPGRREITPSWKEPFIATRGIRRQAPLSGFGHFLTTEPGQDRTIRYQQTEASFHKRTIDQAERNYARLAAVPSDNFRRYRIGEYQLRQPVLPPQEKV